MRFKVFLGAIALAISVLAIGCGGSSGTGTSSSGSGADGTTTASSDSGAPLAKSEFIKKGDTICRGVPKEFEALRNELVKKKFASKEEVNLKAGVPPIYVAVKKMEELAPPKGDEAEVKAIIDALEAAAKGLEKEPNTRLAGSESPFVKFSKLTTSYGFSFCPVL